MKQRKSILKEENIKNYIQIIRDVQVIIDSDLARLYNVTTKALNQAVKRNIRRFPKDFMFSLNKQEKQYLVTKCDHLESLKYSYQLPLAFTEQGITMLSGVLKSKKAIEINVQIMRAFVSMRTLLKSNNKFVDRMSSVEQQLLKHNSQIEQIFDIIEKDSLVPNKGIFFDGQIFDSYKFISKLIKNAKKSIFLFDNYIDESVLNMFSKRRKNVFVKIYTKNLSDQLKLDLMKYNSQYEKIEIKKFSKSHDRFLIIDKKDIYHIGASLKDLGKKWFAFSKFSEDIFKIVNKLK